MATRPEIDPIPVEAAPVAGDRPRWICRLQAARELGVTPRIVSKVAVAAQIHVKQIPGRRGTLYLLSDVLRVARESVSIAGDEEPGKGVDRGHAT